MSMLLNIFGVAQVALAPSTMVQLYEGFLHGMYVRKRIGDARFPLSYAQRNLMRRKISVDSDQRLASMAHAFPCPSRLLSNNLTSNGLEKFLYFRRISTIALSKSLAENASSPNQLGFLKTSWVNWTYASIAWSMVIFRWKSIKTMSLGSTWCVTCEFTLPYRQLTLLCQFRQLSQTNHMDGEYRRDCLGFSFDRELLSE